VQYLPVYLCLTRQFDICLVWIKIIEFQTQAAAAAAVKVDVAASISHDLTFDVTSKITADQ